MKKTNKVRITLSPTTSRWGFDLINRPRIEFDQAVVNITYRAPGYIEGYAQSVHGVDWKVAGCLDAETRASIGLTNLPRLTTGHRLHRLYPGGEVGVV